MYKNKVFIYFIVVNITLLSSYISAQDVVHSLENKSYSELNEYFFLHHSDNVKKAKQAARAYLLKAKSEKNFKHTADGYYFHYLLNDTTSVYLDSIIEIARKEKNDLYTAYAYFNKGKYFLYKKREINKTLNCLNIARNYTITNDSTDLLYRINYHIGVIKSEHLDQKKEALVIFKKCENFYVDKTKNIYISRYLNVLHAIAETYIGLQKSDSTTYYNKLGYGIASRSNIMSIKENAPYFTLCEGINQYNKKNYSASLDSITKAKPLIIDFKDKSNTIDCFYYLGKLNFDLKNDKKAIHYFLKTDSVLETLNSIPQYKHVKTYEYLKNYYKNNNNLEKRNKYLDKLNNVLDKYLNDQMSISKKVKNDYDIPLLLEEKEMVIKELSTNNNKYINSIYALIVTLLILSIVLSFQYRKKRIYRSRFENLMQDLNSKISDSEITSKKDLTIEKVSNIQVPEKHVSYILEKLEGFEKNHDYLVTGLSSQSLADTMDTNVKYLSRVINHYKNKSFTTYLNELRIDYAIKELQQNTVLRKYTIKAIANEFGYSTAETFSNAFYKQVRIKPSYYIKELSKA